MTPSLRASVLIWNKGMEEKSGVHGVWDPNRERPFLSPHPRDPYMEDKGKEPCRRLRTKKLLLKEMHRFKLGSLSYKSFPLAA